MDNGSELAAIAARATGTKVIAGKMAPAPLLAPPPVAAKMDAAAPSETTAEVDIGGLAGIAARAGLGAVPSVGLANIATRAGLAVDPSLTVKEHEGKRPAAYMAYANLKNIVTDASDLLSIFNDRDVLPQWADEALSNARMNVTKILQYVRAEKTPLTPSLTPGAPPAATVSGVGAVAVKLISTKAAVADLDEAVRGGQAMAELENKSLRDIQQETAYTWTWRGWARYKKAKAAKTTEERIKWLLEAEECGHEGREHAALVGGFSVLQDIERILASAQK